MLFGIALILGFISLVLLLVDPILGIIGLIFCALLVVAGNNRRKRQLDAQRHAEILEAMKNK